MAPEFCDDPFVSELRRISVHVEADRSRLRPFQRARIVRAEIRKNGRAVPVAVKAFGRQGLVGSLVARTRGSHAARAFEVASALRAHGVGTPAPIAFLERWDGARLAESYFLSEYQEGMTSFHRELVRLYREDPQFEKILALMDHVAHAVRAMHDAGVFHGDMGNQNICLRRVGDADWADVQFIDLNRGRVRDRLEDRERAFDLSRLTLPHKLARIFRHMYFRERFLGGQRPPRSFERLERFYRARFALHSWTRPLRHPVRWFRNRRLEAAKPRYPPTRELWIWDEPTGQPIRTIRNVHRLLHLAPVSALRIAYEASVAALPTFFGYRRLRPLAYRREVPMEGGAGMTVTFKAATADREMDLLARLGRLPLLARYYRHESEREWDTISANLRRAHAAGHPVSVALVQDPRAVRDPSVWRAFVTHVLDGVGDITEWAEVGHATNRIKWGIWDLHEYQRLLAPFAELRERYPRVKLLGPAVNDFETHYIAAKVRALPRKVRLDGLSLHLYVDRRGAPENRQYGFSALEKFVLARTLAETSPRCGNHVIVSEVNWFLKYERAYASPFAPFEFPWQTLRGTTVTEDTYADYMIRYYLHAICSGMVDRVYWWRLVAGYFGLVSDVDPLRWHVRPAFEALRVFLDLLGKATFVAREPTPEGLHLLRFRLPGGDGAAVAFSANGGGRMTLPFECARSVGLTGEELTRPGREIDVSGRPVYLLGIPASTAT